MDGPHGSVIGTRFVRVRIIRWIGFEEFAIGLPVEFAEGEPLGDIEPGLIARAKRTGGQPADGTTENLQAAGRDARLDEPGQPKRSGRPGQPFGFVNVAGHGFAGGDVIC